MAKIVWLLEETVSAIHYRQVSEHSGAEGVREAGLLSSALAHPQNLLAYARPRPDLASLAAAYAYGIARNHPFVDGNKRTALVAARTFLIVNGVDLKATQDEKYLTFLELAKGSLTEEQLADWIRKRIV
jgi:death-on-curing protein